MDNDTLEQILNQLPIGDRKKAENLLKLEEDKDLPILEEIQRTNEILEGVLNRKIPAPIVNIEPPIVKVEAPIVNVPAPKVEVKTEKVDMTKTNTLLQKILDKEVEPVDISVSLKIV